jgi:hypothetical protein
LLSTGSNPRQRIGWFDWNDFLSAGRAPESILNWDWVGIVGPDNRSGGDFIDPCCENDHGDIKDRQPSPRCSLSLRLPRRTMIRCYLCVLTLWILTSSASAQSQGNNQFHITNSATINCTKAGFKCGYNDYDFTSVTIAGTGQNTVGGFGGIQNLIWSPLDVSTDDLVLKTCKSQYCLVVRVLVVLCYCCRPLPYRTIERLLILTSRLHCLARCTFAAVSFMFASLSLTHDVNIRRDRRRNLQVCNVGCSCVDDTGAPCSNGTFAPTSAPTAFTGSKTCPKVANTQYCAQLNAVLQPGNLENFDCFNFCGGAAVGTCSFGGTCGTLTCSNSTGSGAQGLVQGCTKALLLNQAASSGVDGRFGGWSTISTALSTALVLALTTIQ